MAAPEYSLIVSFIGAFFNILRFAIDIVAVAAKSEDKKEKQLLDKSTSSRESLKNSTKVFDGRLSTNKFSNVAENNANEGSTDVEEAEAEVQIERTPLEKLLSVASLSFQLCAFIFFLVMTIFIAKGDTKYDSINDAVYSAIPLGASTVGVFFGLWVSIRDYNRMRFSFAQRLCFVFSTAITMLGCIVLVSSPPSTSAGSTAIDYIVMACLIAYFILALVESKIFRYPSEMVVHDEEKSNKKAHLGRAILLILKPYFWPDATASSALLNRTRAICTWFCVAGAKGCSLASPLFLGKASTALAQFDYAGKYLGSYFDFVK